MKVRKSSNGTECKYNFCLQSLVESCGPEKIMSKNVVKYRKNYRTRCSALFQTSDENILIDTSPDLRQQLLRHKIKKINKVLYSHMHGDQTHGINDLRSFFINSRKPVDVYADKFTSNYLLKTFSYIFKSYSREYPATLKLNKLKNNFFTLNNNRKIKIKSI